MQEIGTDPYEFSSIHAFVKNLQEQWHMKINVN